jgi:hypothetical protein
VMFHTSRNPAIERRESNGRDCLEYVRLVVTEEDYPLPRFLRGMDSTNCRSARG